MEAWVLDLDFDFCVRPTVAVGRRDRGGDVAEGRLWIGADELLAWLAERSLLRPATFAGWTSRHEQVLPVWQRLLQTGRLDRPFNVLHVDGHPDLMDLDPEIAAALDADPARGFEFFDRARSGDFLQYAIRCGWIGRIWMVFPDHRDAEIEAIGRLDERSVEAIVRKPVQAVRPGPLGGARMVTTIGTRQLDVGLFTRRTLPALPPPAATVAVHSPEFIPASGDSEFGRLIARLRGVDGCLTA